MVVLRNPFYSVLALVGHLLSLAVLFLLLRAEFLAAAQVVVYAGAVMVLYVFVVAYIGGVEEPIGEERTGVAKVGPLFALALLVELSSPCSAPACPRSTATAPRRPRLRLARRDRAAAARALPDAVRGGVVPAAGRGRGRGAGAQAAARPRGGGERPTTCPSPRARPRSAIPVGSARPRRLPGEDTPRDAHPAGERGRARATRPGAGPSHETQEAPA